MTRRLTGRFEARPMAGVNLTPLIPVLLALFAVVAVTAARPGKPVNLLVEPGSVPPDTGELALRPVVMSLGADGFRIDTLTASDAEDAVRRAARLAKTRNMTSVAIRADADVPYARVAELVRRLNAVGLRAQFINEDPH